ncbi:hypothetical protein HBA54_19575 [Pelagibius litoralis]|uniref:Alpha/beta hydrolase n=1 Tax=Pelagibius litoralis TaxID=374515 RepID=A0A967F0L3_9PROT|nr:hypothetical protein [Pelagibius litoralis]NIA70804.1 hypothetical protein [Pelagibius litoralis]
MSDSDREPVARKRRAIILIPGLKREERFVRRDILINNLETVERHPVSRVGEVVVEGEAGLRLSFEPLRSAESQGGHAESASDCLDVFEAYWADMIPEQTELPPWAKLFKGLELVGYWVFSLRTWRAFFSSLVSGSFLIAFGLIMGGLTLVVWYLLLAVLVGQAVAPGGAVPDNLQNVPLMADMIALFGQATGWLASHAWWAVLPFVLTLLQVDAIVLLARFIKDYFENQEDENGVGLRDRLRKRIATTLRAVMAADYDEVVIVAHSFGTVVATDILADWPHRADFKRLTLVSLGSPITVLRYRSSWLEAERKRMLKHEGLDRWVDFFSPSDWLCGEVTGHRGRYGEGMSRRLSFEAPWPQKLSGRTHLLYYRDPRVLECLVAPLSGLEASATAEPA